MFTPAENNPVAIGEAYEGRKKLNAMAEQIELATSRRATMMAPTVYMRYLLLSPRPITIGVAESPYT